MKYWIKLIELLENKKTRPWVFCSFVLIFLIALINQTNLISSFFSVSSPKITPTPKIVPSLKPKADLSIKKTVVINLPIKDLIININSFKRAYFNKDEVRISATKESNNYITMSISSDKYRTCRTSMKDDFGLRCSTRIEKAYVNQEQYICVGNSLFKAIITKISRSSYIQIDIKHTSSKEIECILN